MADTTTILKRTLGLLFSCSCFLTACSGNFSAHMDEMLNEYSCEENAPFKVGPNRDVVFFVKHHIMVGDVQPGVDQSDATGFTRTTQHRIPWENDRFAFYRKKTIPALMQGVNEIFYDNNTHIFLVNDTLEIRADDHFSPADFDLLGNPQDHTRQVMEKIAAEEPGYIHLLYGWTSSTSLLAAGDGLAVVIADDPRYGSRITSRDLARAIIHALGYTPQVGSYKKSSLLQHEGSGDNLSDDQVENIWDVINLTDKALKSISCSKQKNVESPEAKSASWDK